MHRMSEKGEEPTAGTRPTRQWPCSRMSQAACSVAVVLMSLLVICGSLECSNLASVFLASRLCRFSTRWLLPLHATKPIAALSSAATWHQFFSSSPSCLSLIFNMFASSSPRHEVNCGSLKPNHRFHPPIHTTKQIAAHSSQIATSTLQRSLNETERLAAEKCGVTNMQYQSWENGQGGQQVHHIASDQKLTCTISEALQPSDGV